MTRSVFIVILQLIIVLAAKAQDNDYLKLIREYQDKYVKNHEVVKGKDKGHFHFFAPDGKYRVTARFERIYEAQWFNMPTSANKFKGHRVYGILHFTINDTALKLHVYQSQDLMINKKYADYLFVPFTDKTCGFETYDNGRYIDLMIQDVESGSCILDFNKAYNPYCAYVSGIFNCPIPPKENDLPVAIRSGEMSFGKGH